MGAERLEVIEAIHSQLGDTDQRRQKHVGQRDQAVVVPVRLSGIVTSVRAGVVGAEGVSFVRVRVANVHVGLVAEVVVNAVDHAVGVLRNTGAGIPVDSVGDFIEDRSGGRNSA